MRGSLSLRYFLLMDGVGLERLSSRKLKDPPLLRATGQTCGDQMKFQVETVGKELARIW